MTLNVFESEAFVKGIATFIIGYSIYYCLSLINFPNLTISQN